MKDYIDRKFMSMYSTGLDAMADKMMTTKSTASSKAEEQGVAAAAGPEALAAVSAAKMRCGGCGGKVSHVCLDMLFLQVISCHWLPICSDDAAVTLAAPASCTTFLVHIMVWSPQPGNPPQPIWLKLKT